MMAGIAHNEVGFVRARGFHDTSKFTLELVYPLSLTSRDEYGSRGRGELRLQSLAESDSVGLGEAFAFIDQQNEASLLPFIPNAFDIVQLISLADARAVHHGKDNICLFDFASATLNAKTLDFTLSWLPKHI